MIGVGLVGCGYWGANLLRNLRQVVDIKYIQCCDIDDYKLSSIEHEYRNIKTTKSFQTLLNSKLIDAVVIATPAFTHYELAMEALEAGKHVLVEKPMTQTWAQSQKLVGQVFGNEKVLMVDHTYIYSGAVYKIKELINTGQLGNINFIDSVRANLGKIQGDINVIYDLAPHDISIMNYLLDKKPKFVGAVGTCHTYEGLEDVAYLTMDYGKELIGHVNVCWLSPLKIRQMVICGDKRMVVFNDLEPDEKVKVYNCGVDYDRRSALVDYRLGDISIPRLDRTEPLLAMCRHFVDCIINNKKPLTDGQLSADVVHVLDWSNRSLKQRGKLVDLNKETIPGS